MFKTLVFSVWFMFHPVHVTLTSIDYIPEHDSLKVFVKMYFDDFLLDLRLSRENAGGEDFSEGSLKSRDVMADYLAGKLIIEVNKKLLTGKLGKMEIADNEVKLSIEYGSVKDPEIISVKNQIMTDLYEDQSNFMILRINEFEEGIKLTSEITGQTFKIK